MDLIELEQLSIKGKSIDSFSIYVYLIEQYSIDPHYLTLIVYEIDRPSSSTLGN